ncbi:putative HAT dimerization domain, ribonuclease H-like superfamily, hAT-like transposase, RNase-H [Helianthus annuus]|nr:putative HAT dimerization domain, ribonuclease H-like superfamily, hAT-like transposase, RNase-H [Helianthus annuus]KAJ0460424.1 putative HAT dimerization domain, ribonuclease H-like superfamily, hAT-like transposase, RNase-H [Helianthus annuus]KAJ0640866.1 putative HAT dimerization domain, ribonuclease H-like superfamily, hAT-like transposase, RNase-H [Helianthus annuus]KAJ0644781.1 putative HAT dimerization domain, ribonuclease H-like superfamily, hAT-like transposase, RNase-H [Helianthus a
MSMAPRSRSVKRRKIDYDSVQKALVDMIIADELPFSVVEEEEFIERMKTVFLGFDMPTSDMISRDCAQRFMDDKLKLKSFIKRTKQRVCLSLDTWRRSNQSVNYLCITAHFIDNNWNMHKKIIGFSPICSDNGEEIGKVVKKCLLDWEISHVLAVSAGNASSYDAAISYLGKRLANPVLDGKFLRLKCFNDFANNMVKQVLKDYDKWIIRVRAAVRYMQQSPDRIKKFEDFARQHRMPSDDCLTLDWPSCWLSTFEMLSTAQKFEDVFNWFEEKDPMYKRELSTTCGSPVYIKWEKVRKAVCCLKGLFWLTGKRYNSDVTSNMFFGQIAEADFGLVDWETSWVRSAKLFFRPVEQKWKYNEYWGDVKDSNMLIYIATILDPRYKMDYIECCFGDSLTLKHEYTDEGEPSWKKKVELVVAAAYDLFNVYATKLGAPHRTANFQTSGFMDYLCHATSSLRMGDRREVGFGGNVGCEAEIDIYLNEELIAFDRFDILVWWKVNEKRFPVLTKMAKDVLAIPISAVTLLSDNNNDGNLLGDFQSSVSPSMAEALVCTQDWINNSKKQIKVQDASTELGNVMKGIYEQLEDDSSGCGSTSS